MESKITVRLNLSDEQRARMEELQAVFAEACNSLGPIVVKTRCWNRVGLHHLAYRLLRERFPRLGAQMACNAIYSVSRACRKIYQNPASQWFVGKQSEQGLPLISFSPRAPVFFDRHTLSLKDGQLSMFTLDGRLRFKINITPQIEQRFMNEKLKEIKLSSDKDDYMLTFNMAEQDAADQEADAEMPEYLLVSGAQDAMEKMA